VAVLNLDAALVAGRDGEDVGLDGAGANVFQQRWIAKLAHDGIVNGPRLRRFQDLGVDRLPIDPHGQLADHSPFRQREEVSALGEAIALVHE
jgi:hypothetical protein